MQENEVNRNIQKFRETQTETHIKKRTSVRYVDLLNLVLSLNYSY